MVPPTNSLKEGSGADGDGEVGGCRDVSGGTADDAEGWEVVVVEEVTVLGLRSWSCAGDPEAEVGELHRPLGNCCIPFPLLRRCGAVARRDGWM